MFRSNEPQINDTLLPPANKVCEGYIFTCVCHSVHSGGSTWAGTSPGPGAPQDQVHPHIPGTPSHTRFTPWDQVHPLGPGSPSRLGTPPCTRYTPLDQVHPWDQVHPPGPGTHPPLGPGTPPGTRYTPDQVHPRTQVHPPRSSACWEIRATSGRYASYWNAFL